MIEQTELFPGITLRCCRDPRFKQSCLSLQILRPMCREEAALNAMLPAVLLRGSRLHPTLRSITHRLDALYGSAVAAQVRRIGDYQTTGLYAAFMDDRFALPGDQVMEPMIDFIRELLLDPLLEDGKFSQVFVDSEKKNLISAIESARNDKQVYATSQMLKLMCKNDSFGLPRLGEISQVAQVTPEALTDHWKRILKISPINLFYVGSADAGTVAELLRPVFAGLERQVEELPPQTAYHVSEKVDRVETLNVAQGKLCMGFTTGITNRDPEFAAMQVLNTILGGGMSCKLFNNVREKLSLCYSIGSGYYSTKGIMTVSAGIDFDKEERTKAEILRQLHACCQGQITDQEMEAAKQPIYSSLRASQDSPGAIESYYSTAALSGLTMTPEAYIQAVEAVTRDQVVAAARAIELHTTYFLKGESR